MVCLAIAIGGLWAVFQFFTVLLPRTQKELFAQAQVNVKVEAREEHLVETGESYVLADVRLTNGGGRNVFLDYNKGRITVQRLQVEANKPEWVDDQEPRREWAHRVLRSGETDELSFVVKVPRPGLYRVVFQVPLPDAEMQEHNRALEKLGQKATPGSIFWQGSAVVNVRGGAAGSGPKGSR
jgi:hypothetical protein